MGPRNCAATQNNDNSAEKAKGGRKRSFAIGGVNSKVLTNTVTTALLGKTIGPN